MAAYRVIFGGRGTFVVLAVLVVSHWVLDWVTHAPDMPLYPGGPKEGLALWNSVPATMLVETLMFAAGLYVYTRTTRAKDAIGRWGFGLPRCYPRRDLRGRRALRDAPAIGIRDLRGCPGGVGGVRGLGLVDGQTPGTSNFELRI